MKGLILFLTLFVCLVSSHKQDTNNCPPGEHPRPDCPQYYEPWCTIPTVHPLNGKMARVCPEPPCFCNEPTVRNMDTGKCVPLSECPET